MHPHWDIDLGRKIFTKNYIVFITFVFPKMYVQLKVTNFLMSYVSRIYSLSSIVLLHAYSKCDRGDALVYIIIILSQP